jgi:phosphoribosylaminoimidazole-succinocarboxamide synthase
MAPKVMAVNNDLPIRTDKPIHSGKVRAVYWLTAADSARLIAERKYNVAPDASLAVMVISDRISAYEIIWKGAGGVDGVPGKGAALNAISNHWFQLFRERGLADSHILEIPHPLVWIVQRAQPVMVEAICRQYITGSMWRDYTKGSRCFCGIDLPEGLKKDQKLPELLITPSTKGILTGIPGVPEQDDVNVSRADIIGNYKAFGFDTPDDVAVYERLLTEGFAVIRSECPTREPAVEQWHCLMTSQKGVCTRWWISDALAGLDQIFVDTKFEFGYVSNAKGERQVGVLDSWSHLTTLSVPFCQWHPD